MLDISIETVIIHRLSAVSNMAELVDVMLRIDGVEDGVDHGDDELR